MHNKVNIYNSQARKYLDLWIDNIPPEIMKVNPEITIRGFGLKVSKGHYRGCNLIFN